MKITLPFYAHLALVLFTIWILLYGIYLGQDILIPIGFSFLISVLLRPLEKLLERMKIPRVIAIFLSLIVAAAVIFGVFTLLSYQVSKFIKDLPAIESNLTNFFNSAQEWVSNKFHFSIQQQQQAIQNAKSNGMGSVKAIAGTTLGVLTSSLAIMALIPIYVLQNPPYNVCNKHF